MKQRFFVGCYTQPEGHVPNGCGEGVYACQLDTENGTIKMTDVYRDIVNPSFVTVAGDHVLAVAEISDAPGTAYVLDKDLTLRSQQSTEGEASCHITAVGDRVVVSSYMGGSITAYPFSSGSIGAGTVIRYSGSGPNAERQEAPHAHQSVASPDGRHLYVCDLGTDHIWIHDLHDNLADSGSLTVPGGYGPRHMCFHPTLPVAYIVCELSGKLLVCSHDRDCGGLTIINEVDTLPLDCAFAPASAAIKLHPSGKALYVSNRGHDSCTVYRIDDATGAPVQLSCFACGGEQPRDLAVDPSGRWILFANQDSDSITVFPVDPATFDVDGNAVQRFSCKTPTSLHFE